MKKNICFLMPAVGYAPSGGFKVVFEYANRFCDDGYKVSIAFAASKFWMKQSWKEQLKSIVRFFMNKFPQRHTPYRWFDLNRNIDLYPVWSLSEKFVPKASIYIATSVETAVYLNNYKKTNPLAKFYLIQDFENWGLMTEKDLKETYHYPMHKIVISTWLHCIMEQERVECQLIPNGFDFSHFRLSIPIPEKDKFCITMLYHQMERKGCKYGFKALDIVKKKYPQLSVNLFGTVARPIDLPAWYNYYQSPNKETHNRIYNEAAIFLGTSTQEGWGLTIGEAMICGQAVVCTDNLGYQEMAINGKTALVSPIRNVQSLAENIIKLIENDFLRYSIAKNGNQYIQQFTWEKAYSKFKELIETSSKV